MGVAAHKIVQDERRRHAAGCLLTDRVEVRSVQSRTGIRRPTAGVRRPMRWTLNGQRIVMRSTKSWEQDMTVASGKLVNGGKLRDWERRDRLGGPCPGHLETQAVFRCVDRIGG